MALLAGGVFFFFFFFPGLAKVTLFGKEIIHALYGLLFSCQQTASVDTWLQGIRLFLHLGFIGSCLE